MSKNRGFSNTSANRYSLALYELASENNLLTQVESNSSALLLLISTNKEFKSLTKDPVVKQDVLLKIINKISENSNFEVLFKNFLGLLVIKRRFFFVKQILESFIEICSEKKGELKAEIRSAQELSSEDINQIKDELSNNFSSKIKLNYKLDQSLIGGLILQVGSTMIDTSIKNKLQQIEKKMIEA